MCGAFEMCKASCRLGGVEHAYFHHVAIGVVGLAQFGQGGQRLFCRIKENSQFPLQLAKVAAISSGCV